jgi:beta-lactamase regulating signal transducer with metallopeptidase domain
VTVALALLTGTMAVGWHVPGLLRRVDLRRRDPVLLIVAWLLSIAGVVLAAAAFVAMLLLPDHGPAARVFAAIHDSWAVLEHGAPPEVEELTGLLGVMVLVALALRIAIVAVRGSRQRAHRRRANLAVLQVAGRRGDSNDVLWLAHDQPLAFSMTGRPGVVVATEGLTRHLHEDAVAAVLAHERAHLTGRHHLLVAMAQALRTTLPFVPLFRQAPAAIQDLVELAADVSAVRTCGPAAVRSALLTVTRHSTPGTSLAMAQHAVDLRLERLRTPAHPPSRAHRAIAYALTATTAVTLPFLAGTSIATTLALLLS